MTHTENITAAPGDIAAARLLLNKMGIDPADLLQDPAAAPEIPTFADDIPPRLAGSQRRDTPRLQHLLEPGNRGVGAETHQPGIPLEISQLTEDTKANVIPRRNARGGRSAAEHLIGALRCMYNHAVADGFLPEAENPAARVPKPRRLPSSRMALPDSRLAELSAVAASTGNDPALDSLIIRLHTETACRHAAARWRSPRKTSIPGSA